MIDSGCGSSAEQVAMNELEKLLVAHTRYEKCQWLIKPRLNGKTPSYPVIRLAQGVTPSLGFYINNKFIQIALPLSGQLVNFSHNFYQFAC